jgi:hypothetical protein
VCASGPHAFDSRRHRAAASEKTLDRRFVAAGHGPPNKHDLHSISFISIQNSHFTIHFSIFLSPSIRSESFQKVGVEPAGSEVRVRHDPPMNRD